MKKKNTVALTEKMKNILVNWTETHHEVVAQLTIFIVEHKEAEEVGTHRLYELGMAWTDEFEQINEDRAWDGEFFDEIEEFMQTKLDQLLIELKAEKQ